jgi:predicted NAD-dependent protein-ADP-ribosyltransferase YbiA (DUF1768 family)
LQDKNKPEITTAEIYSYKLVMGRNAIKALKQSWKFVKPQLMFKSVVLARVLFCGHRGGI